uniref:Uncharacterized protein n=1 Tax=Caenorhabditis japonica TaxID=281687 RepID=A0A8R1DQN9_CAEJA
MYPLCMCHVIVAFTIMCGSVLINCMNNKKNKSGEKISTNVPVVYETDPAILEREKRQRAAENRERMRRKREKVSRVDPVKDASREVKKESKAVKNSKEFVEDYTQNPNSEDTGHSERMVRTAVDIYEKSQETTVTIPPNSTERRSSDEQLGDVQLVDNDPDSAAKASLIKRQAKELAKKKQAEEAMMKKAQMIEPFHSPDDTMKNVSSIQAESQMSAIQKDLKYSEMVTCKLAEKVAGGGET